MAIDIILAGLQINSKIVGLEPCDDNNIASARIIEKMGAIHR